MIYITGDTHGDFTRINNFCKRMETTKDDIMIILGDAGINYYVHETADTTSSILYRDGRNLNLKKKLESLPITLFCIHGNHEARPEHIEGYEEFEWNGGVVYRQEQYPSLLFAKDGQTYLLNGKRTLVLGGAYSVDKYYRLHLRKNGISDAFWFPDEQMSAEMKEKIEEKIKYNNTFDTILSHTVPYQYRPIEMFLSNLDQNSVDNSMERWLEKIEAKLHYKKWYAGHYHINKKHDKLQLLFEDIQLFE